MSLVISLSTAFSRLVGSANALNARATSLSTGLSTTNSTVGSLSTSASTAVSSLSTALSGGGGGGSAYASLIVSEESGSNAGGAAVSGWNNRTLNTVNKNTIAGASLSSSTVTLPSGTYSVRGFTTVYRCDAAVARLRVAGAGGAELLKGPPGYTTSSIYGTGINLLIDGEFTITDTTAILLQAYLLTVASAGTNALGAGGGTSPYRFSQLTFVKIG